MLVTQIRWGIIGPGTIAHNFANGLHEASSGSLTAIASRNQQRRQTFGDAYGIAPDKRFASYEALIADPVIDAIYIATPHTHHAEQAIMAMRGGKSVLCEKPAGVTAAQAIAMTETAAQEKIFFMEAMMYRCHPQIARVIELIRAGTIGEVTHLRSSLGFAATFDPASRLFDRTLAGGAILDVGVYPVSLARLIAGAVQGGQTDDPVSVRAVGRLGQSKVDEEAHALLQFKGGLIAECGVSLNRPLSNDAIITGTKGTIRLVDPWTPGRDAGPSDAIIEISKDDTTQIEKLERKEHLFAFEAEQASQWIAAGRLEAETPAATWADSIGNAQTLDRWRQEIGYRFEATDAAVNRTLPGVLPANPIKIPKKSIEGIDLPMSALIMGCDNRDSFADGAIIWDAWLEAGGNAFDTAFVYGDGLHEKVLGTWLESRGVGDQVIIISKGAHTPYCTPRCIETQLTQSLDRLGVNSVPIYIMHRDNPDVPVGEFVDALNRLHNAGRIGLFGGSNWSTARFDEANAYTHAHNLKPMRILNNNLSLAVMEKPVWDGCMSRPTRPDTLAHLRQNNVIHLSWSSQARGYFLPEDLRNRLPADTGPETCFGSETNAERRRRADQLAQNRGVSAHNIATAWVLAQSFPSFALIGPRSAGEIASTLPGLGIDLTPDEVAWLNLETN